MSPLQLQSSSNDGHLKVLFFVYCIQLHTHTQSGNTSSMIEMIRGHVLTQRRRLYGSLTRPTCSVHYQVVEGGLEC